MKKLFLVGALALSSVFAASAQGLEGKWFAGGQLGYTHSKLKVGDFSAKADTYTILPMAGTFISSDVAVGAQLGYAGSKDGDFKTNQMIIAPLVRKYWNISGGLYFFGQASLPIGFGDVNFAYNKEKEANVLLDKKAKTLGVNIQLAPGFDYIINEKFSVETSFNVLSLGYNQTKVGGSKSTDFGFFANEGSKFGDLKIGFKMIF